jgi:hypothetical protein
MLYRILIAEKDQTKPPTLSFFLLPPPPHSFFEMTLPVTRGVAKAGFEFE